MKPFAPNRDSSGFYKYKFSVQWLVDSALFDQFRKSLTTVEHLTVSVFEVFWAQMSDRSLWQATQVQ